MGKNEKNKKAAEAAVPQADTAEVSVNKDSKPAKGADAKKASKSKKVAKKENFFVRIWKKFAKLCKDTVGEMKKVTWTPRKEVFKSTKLVVVAVIAVGIVIAVIDLGCSYLINTIAGLIG